MVDRYIQRANRTQLPPEVSYASNHRIILSELGNISISGAFIVSQTPDPVGTKGTLAFKIGGKSYGIPVRVERVSFWAGPERDRAGMGLSFMAISKHIRKAIEAWQESLNITQPGRKARRNQDVHQSASADLTTAHDNDIGDHIEYGAADLITQIRSAQELELEHIISSETPRYDHHQEAPHAS